MKSKKKVDDDWKKQFIQFKHIAKHVITCYSMFLKGFMLSTYELEMFHNEENAQRKRHKTDSTYILFRMYAALQLMEKQERNV